MMLFWTVTNTGLRQPYESQHAAVMYANDNADKAVLFAFDIHPRYAESIQPLRLQGLKEDARYELKEINLVPGTQSRLACNGKTFSGEFLMNVGIPVFSSRPTNSHVLKLQRSSNQTNCYICVLLKQ